jgi:hypothetical protein
VLLFYNEVLWADLHPLKTHLKADPPVAETVPVSSRREATGSAFSHASGSLGETGVQMHTGKSEGGHGESGHCKSWCEPGKYPALLTP